MIQRVGVNTRVQRQNTSNNKPQNFGMSIPKQQVTMAITRSDANTINSLVRAIQSRKFHTNREEVADSSKFLAENYQKATEANDKNGIIGWGILKRAFDGTSARWGFS